MSDARHELRWLETEWSAQKMKRLEGCGGLRKTYHLLGAATYTIQSPEIQRTIIRGDVAQSLLENFTGFRSLEMSCFHKLEA